MSEPFLVVDGPEPVSMGQPPGWKYTWLGEVRPEHMLAPSGPPVDPETRPPAPKPAPSSWHEHVHECWAAGVVELKRLGKGKICIATSRYAPTYDEQGQIKRWDEFGWFPAAVVRRTWRPTRTAS